MTARLRPVPRRHAPAAGTWLADQLRNIAPFVTLIFLVAFFSLREPVLRHARQRSPTS